jgi:hypothetical protein
MKITIKSLPISKNEYKDWHWAKKGRYLEIIKWEIWAEILRYTLRPKKPIKKAILNFKLYFETNRKRDSQNYIAGGLIAMIDSLVKLGIIVDDNYKVIGDPAVELYIDKDNPRTEIIIEKSKVES